MLFVLFDGLHQIFEVKVSIGTDDSQPWVMAIDVILTIIWEKRFRPSVGVDGTS